MFFCVRRQESSRMAYRKPGMSMRAAALVPDDYCSLVTDSGAVHAILQESLRMTDSGAVHAILQESLCAGQQPT